MIDRPSAGSCLIPACSELISSTARWGDSDGCPGDGDSAKPFPFAANQEEEVEEGRGRGGVGDGGGVRGRQRSSQSHSHRAEEPVGWWVWWAGLPVLHQLRKTNPGIH